MMLEDKNVCIVVTELMHEIGAPAHLKGHDYLVSALCKSYTDRSYLENVTNKLYPAIAAEYDTTASGVERGIRTVIESAWLRGNNHTIDTIFKNTVDCIKAKPSNKEFMSMIICHLKISNM